ncbi:hypothetical protein J2W28_000634 [Variovorax boronicumulans]|nr:hypothetical protein [Variovorax boronicumulans]MDP9989986.1 hypothetical protein [Variovorax boronicumulans]MDQ0001506.1 hypothetical protein [Variovorax boronicumulans]
MLDQQAVLQAIAVRRRKVCLARGRHAEEDAGVRRLPLRHRHEAFVLDHDFLAHRLQVGQARVEGLHEFLVGGPYVDARCTARSRRLQQRADIGTVARKFRMQMVVDGCEIVPVVEPAAKVEKAFPDARDGCHSVVFRWLKNPA